MSTPRKTHKPPETSALNRSARIHKPKLQTRYQQSEADLPGIRWLMAKSKLKNSASEGEGQQKSYDAGTNQPNWWYMDGNIGIESDLLAREIFHDKNCLWPTSKIFTHKELLNFSNWSLTVVSRGRITSAQKFSLFSFYQLANAKNVPHPLPSACN